MDKRFALIFLSFFMFTFVSGQYQSNSGYYENGSVNEGLSMESSILKSKVNFAVYLPPDYDKSTQKYPVLYLLHGRGDNEIAWIQWGEVQRTLDRAIANREVSPMIIVMPDAKVTWYINDYAGKNRYEDMIFKEFIPYIDKTYRTRTEKEHRAVAGLSMGGYGSLIWSLHHPEMFSACAAFSAAVFTEDEIKNMTQERYDDYWKEMYGPANQVNRISEYWRKHSVIDLMSTLPKEQIEKVKFYIDCGDDDFLFTGNSSLHVRMRERNIYHEYRVKDGPHGWTYWRTNIIDGLIFISRQFRRQITAPVP